MLCALPWNHTLDLGKLDARFRLNKTNGRILAIQPGYLQRAEPAEQRLGTYYIRDQY